MILERTIETEKHQYSRLLEKTDFCPNKTVGGSKQA